MPIKLVSSDQCIPCKLLKKWLEEHGVKFKEINVDTEEGLKFANEKNIRAIPTVIKDGKILFIGLPPEKRLKEIFNVKD